jgi:4-hydroxy-tetrahydrodipicolinate reductase
VRLSLELSSHLGDHNHAGCVATAMHVINAIPAVCEAAPGVVTALDLPVYTARHAMR